MVLAWRTGLPLANRSSPRPRANGAASQQKYYPADLRSALIIRNIDGA